MAGDLFVGDPIQNVACRKDVFDFISSHDYRICNFEAPIVEEGSPPAKKVGPALRQNQQIIEIVESNLFNVFGLANNHIMDYGKAGLQKTINYFKRSNLSYFGAGESLGEIFRPLIFEKNGLKIGVLAVCEAQFGCKIDKEEGEGFAWIFHQKVEIAKIKSEVDSLILFVHAGLESVPFPLPEWRDCFKNFIDQGADLVVSTHSHCIQGKEVYKGKTIYYSLGNFLFSNKNKVESAWNNSLGLSISFIKTEGKIELSIKEHFFAFNGKQVCFINEVWPERFVELSKILTEANSSEYYEKINNVCVQKWREYYKSYYSFSNFKYSSRFLKLHPVFQRIVKRIVKMFLLENEVDNLMILHNVQIETNRFLVIRALSCIEFSKEKLNQGYKS